MSQHYADKEHRFFLYDPENGGMEFYSSKEERDEAAKNCIPLYCDDGWDEMVEQVCVGEVTAMATQTNLSERQGELDEDGHDEDGEYWGDQDIYARCDYELLPI